MTKAISRIRLSRGHTVVLTSVIAVAFGGLVVGMRPMARPSRGAPSTQAEPARAVAPPGVPYRLLAEQRAATGRVTTDFGLLREGLPAIDAPVARDPEALREALAGRAARRAYEGAPPVIPHAIDERSSASCLTCHRHGARINGRTAPAISHEAYVNCTQCHAPSVARPGTVAPVLTANAFAGRSARAHGGRAWLGAPPAIPHSTWMRGECASCHGVSGRSGIRTTHPQRKSCTQCHVPARSAMPQM